MTNGGLGGPVARAGVVAAVLGLAVTGTLAARYGWHHFIDYDARFFHSVALDLDASEAMGGDSAYRYGRIGLPLIARALAGGTTGLALDAAQMLVTPLALGVLVAIAARISLRLTGRWTDGLVVLLSPGLWVGFAYAWADTLLAACVLVSIWATLERRQAVCLGSLILAVLVKEVGALAVVPAALAALRQGEPRAVILRLGALVPAVGWWGWVRLQAGEWPFLADEPARAHAISAPVVDIVSALTGGVGDPAAALLALIVGAMGIGMLVGHPAHPLAWSAALWGGLTLSLGDNVLRYPGDTLRVMTPAMCVVLLAARVLPAAAPSAGDAASV